MKHAQLLIIICALFGTLAHADPSAAVQLETKRMAFVHDLQKHDSVLSATCDEFTNYILSYADLPMIGTAKDVKGQRLEVDRRGELEHPPSLSDGVARKTPDFSIHIQTGKPAGTNTWAVVLERTYGVEKRSHIKDTFHDKTRFLFDLKTDGTKESCDLKSIDFAQKTEKSKYQFQKTFSANDCIDLLMGPKTHYSHSPKSIVQIGDSVQVEDCKTGIHYFEGVKQMLSKKQ